MRRQAELALQLLDLGVDPGVAGDVARAADGCECRPTLPTARLWRRWMVRCSSPTIWSAVNSCRLMRRWQPSPTPVEANLLPTNLERLSEGMGVQLRIGGETGQLIDGVIRRLPSPMRTRHTHRHRSGVSGILSDGACCTPGGTVDVA